jgi:hypothetical protein
MKLVAFVISSLIGFVIAHYLLEGAAAAYTSILISYHLFLVYLIVSAEHEKGLSMSIGMAIPTHAAFLALLVGTAYMREHVPFFGLIRLLIPALAPFETKWLFSGRPKAETGKAPAPDVFPEATLDDHEAFREHLAQRDRPFRKPGRSLNEEFELWLADRARKRAQASTAAAVPDVSSGRGAATPESPTRGSA